ncbi:hypothetical protein MVEG_07451 [Podila verticillata NRRL 6337]|nr:hypothetical protein MVEG_07451 [Podila verticillata NRRL 6337]
MYKTCMSCSSNKRTKTGFQRKKRTKLRADSEEAERTCIKCNKTWPIADFRWDSRIWRSCCNCTNNKRVASATARHWKRAKLEVPDDARSVKPRRARVHVVDYDQLRATIQSEEGEADVYIKFPVYMNDSLLDAATLDEMAEAEKRKEEKSKSGSSRSRVTKVSDASLQKDLDGEATSTRADEGDVSGSEESLPYSRSVRSSRLVSKSQRSYYDGVILEKPALKDARPSRNSNNSKSNSQPSKKSASAPPHSICRVSQSHVKETIARVHVISRLLKEEFEEFSGFKWNIRKGLELKFEQDYIKARTTYYCGQIRGTGGALMDPSKRTGRGGRPSSARYDCGGRLVFFINLTSQVCVVRYKHTTHPPRAQFAPAKISDAAIEKMRKLAEDRKFKDATGQEMHDHLVSKKLIRHKQFQPIKVAFRWLQIRESKKAKSSAASNSSVSTPSTDPTTGTKDKPPTEPVDTSLEKDDDAEDESVEEGEAEEEELEKAESLKVKSEKGESEKKNSEAGSAKEEDIESEEIESEEIESEEIKSEESEKETDPFDNDDSDDDEASEYEEAVESQERWATPGLLPEEVEKDFEDQVFIDASPELDQAEDSLYNDNVVVKKQRDIEDIVDRMSVLERDMLDPTKTAAEIEAIEKELELLNIMLTDITF